MQCYKQYKQDNIIGFYIFEDMNRKEDNLLVRRYDEEDPRYFRISDFEDFSLEDIDFFKSDNGWLDKRVKVDDQEVKTSFSLSKEDKRILKERVKKCGYKSISDFCKLAIHNILQYEICWGFDMSDWNIE